MTYLISILCILLGAICMGLYPPNRVGVPLFIVGIVFLVVTVFGG